MSRKYRVAIVFGTAFLLELSACSPSAADEAAAKAQEAVAADSIQQAAKPVVPPEPVLTFQDSLAQATAALVQLQVQASQSQVDLTAAQNELQRIGRVKKGQAPNEREQQQIREAAMNVDQKKDDLSRLSERIARLQATKAQLDARAQR